MYIAWNTVTGVLIARNSGELPRQYAVRRSSWYKPSVDSFAYDLPSHQSKHMISNLMSRISGGLDKRGCFHRILTIVP